MAQTIRLMNDGTVKIEDITNRDMLYVPWRNFGGVIRPNHEKDKEGQPYFTVLVDSDVEDVLVKNGWQVDTYVRKSGDPDEEEMHFIKVYVNMKDPKKEWKKPSTIWYFSDPDENGIRRRILLKPDSDEFADLDSAVFETVDIHISGWEHKSGAHAGEKVAYLTRMDYSLEDAGFSDKWGRSVDATNYGGEQEPEELPFG